MSKWFCFKITFVVFLFTVCLFAQDEVLHLWPDGAPGGIENPDYIEGLATDRPNRILRVSDPTISIYLPEADKATGTAVVICPGGGYRRLAFDHEGFEVAEWLNTIGVAGIVLKYRLPSDEIMEDKAIGPLQDVQRAIRIVRRNAQKWNLKPDQIGVMGFSAGGHLAASASTLYKDKVYNVTDSICARPDFSVLVYPFITFDYMMIHKGSKSRLLGVNPDSSLIVNFSLDKQVTSETPPAFLVHSTDDASVAVRNTLLYFGALQSYDVPAEMHIFESGGHGYGMGRTENTESYWTEMFIRWMNMHGLL